MINLGTIGAVAVAIGGDTSGLKKALTEADASLAKTKARMEAVKQVGAALGLALAATAGAIALMTKRSIDYADETGKMAQRVGVATQTLSEMTYVAKLAGVSQQEMANAMGRLNRNIADAAGNTGEAIRAFEALGINVKNADGSLKSADQVMAEMSDKFADMEDGSAKTAIAMMTMGRSGMNMIPMLNGGSRAMGDMRKEAVQFGNVVSDKAAKSSELFNDNITRMGEIVLGGAARIRDAVLPTLVSFSERMLEAAKETDALADAGRAADTGLKLIATAGTIIASVFGIVGKTLGGVGAMIVQLLTGEWREAITTSKNIFTDWQGAVSDAVLSVERTWEDSSKKIGSITFAPGGGGKKKSGPNILSTEEINRRKAEEKELQEKSIQGWVEHAEAVMAAAEEELLAIAEINDEKWRLIDENLEKVRDSYKTEAELQQEKYDNELLALRTALENKALTQEEFDSMSEQAATRHEERMNAIVLKGLTDRERFEQMSMKNKAKTIFGELASITSGVAQHNKKLFELNKVAGIANAVISAYEGISKTLAAYPYPFNIAMAALHGVAAFAQVQAIRGTSFAGGGGGVAPSIAGSTSAPPVSPVGGSQTEQRSVQHTTVILPGTDLTSTSAVREMLRGLSEEIEANGGRLDIQ